MLPRHQCVRLLRTLWTGKAVLLGIVGLLVCVGVRQASMQARDTVTVGSWSQDKTDKTLVKYGVLIDELNWQVQYLRKVVQKYEPEALANLPDGSISSVLKAQAPQVDEVMARLAELRPPHVSLQDWTAPSPDVLSYDQFLKSSFSSGAAGRPGQYVALDIVLRQLLTWPRGFFIESGAHDGQFTSNTLALERLFGWRGLLVEPASVNIPKIHAARSRSITIHAGLVSSDQDGTHMQDPGGHPGAAASVGSGSVKARALSSLLDELNITSIDFWSLDVEGYELNALKGVDFSRHRPKFILIEVWHTNREALMAFMSSVSYTLLPGYDAEGGISGFPNHHPHRDFVWRDSRLPGPPPVILKPENPVIDTAVL